MVLGGLFLEGDRDTRIRIRGRYCNTNTATRNTNRKIPYSIHDIVLLILLLLLVIAARPGPLSVSHRITHRHML